MLRTFSRLLSVFAATALGVLVAATPVQAAETTAAPPNSMASLGDSITRGFNACGWYVDCPSRSWSTGTTEVTSHYQRILAINPAIQGRNYNDAKTGAKAADLAGQADAAVSQGVEYVTILIGANDACTDSESTMTPVSTFRAQIDAAFAKLKQGLPNAKLLVVSIPDIKRLWEVGKDSLAARTAWNTFDICQSMLANPTSTAPEDEARRDRVRQRVIDYNTQLAAACAAYGANCKFDGNAVFNYQFQLSHLSGWDYFHPDTEGQNILADVSYRAGYNW